MKFTQSDYHSYLLRLWRVQEDGQTWRASLECVQTGELHGFPNLAALIGYLQEVGCPEQQEQARLEYQPD